MATKTAELRELQSTLVKKKEGLSAASEQMANDKSQRENTQKAMEADASFFEDMKAECKQKALDWGVRTELQNQELNGIGQAIKILQEGAGPMAVLLQVAATPKTKLVQI